MKTGLLALALLNVVVPACSCGDDDGDGSSTPDAVEFADAGFIPGPTDDAGVPAPWLVSCAADLADAGIGNDAGPPADAATGPIDAGVVDAGAGSPPPGFNDPCCDPNGVCPSGLECI